MPSSYRAKISNTISSVKEPELYLLNRFMRNNSEKQIEIEEIIAYLSDPPLNKLSLEYIYKDVVYFFKSGLSNSDISYVSFVETKTIIRFFEFVKSDTDSFQWKKLKSTVNNYSDDISPEIITYLLKDSKLYSTVNKIDLWEKDSIINKINIDLIETNVFDYLSTFIPDIQKINLLTQSDILSNDELLCEIDLSSNISINLPTVRIANSLNLTNDFPMMDYRNLDIRKSSTYLIKNNLLDIFKNDSMPNIQINGSIDKDYIHEFRKYLEPVIELSEDIKKEILSPLNSNYHSVSNLLFESQHSIIFNSSSPYKEQFTILALKMLLRIRIIRKVLIITSHYQGMIYNNINENYESAWQININTFLNGFSYKKHDEIDRLFNDSLINNHNIHSVNYNLLEEGFIKGTVDIELLNSFDCIILDNCSHEVLSLDSIKILNKNRSLNYLWLFYDTTSIDIVNKTNNIWTDFTFRQIDLKDLNISNHDNNRYEANYFLNAEEESIERLNQYYEDGKKTLDELMQFGNILRFQPNAFQIIHEIQKQGNIIESNGKNIKMELLKYHLKMIFHQTDRILIYSQFDKSGLSDICDLLNELGIESVSFKQVNSQSDIKNKLKICREHSGKLVYLTNMKPTSIKFLFPKVAHIINYDSWWNPIVRWILEDKIEHGEIPISTFNYYIKNSAETSLIEKLNSFGLINKNILEVIAPEKYYQIFDDKHWGNFFDLSYEMFSNQSDRSHNISSMFELVNNTKLFLRFLGYSNINSAADIKTDIFNITASYLNKSKGINISVKCINSEHMSSEIITALINSYGKRTDKLFVVTNGDISYSNVTISENISLINGKQLKKYLSLFKIPN